MTFLRSISYFLQKISCLCIKCVILHKISLFAVYMISFFTFSNFIFSLALFISLVKSFWQLIMSHNPTFRNWDINRNLGHYKSCLNKQTEIWISLYWWRLPNHGSQIDKPNFPFMSAIQSDVAGVEKLLVELKCKATGHDGVPFWILKSALLKLHRSALSIISNFPLIFFFFLNHGIKLTYTTNLQKRRLNQNLKLQVCFFK